MSTIAVFDMNETMLSLEPVREMWDRHVPGASREWFARLLHLSVVSNQTGDYHDFSTLGAAALSYVADAHGYEAKEPALADLQEAMGNLAAHPDVRPGLERLKEEGWTLATLTNSTRAAAAGSLHNTGLIGYFDQVLTVESVEKFKPHPDVYRIASEALQAPLNTMWMVASHDWDLAGAAAVGMKTAFVRRPGLPWAPHFADPDLEVADFVALSEALTGLTQ